MRDKKLYIILIICIFVFFFAMFLLLGVNNIRRGDTAATIVVGDTTIWTYQNGNWTNIRNVTSVQSLNWKEFHTFVDNKEFGDYYLWHDDKWYLFDKKNNAVPFEGTLLAYNSNFKIPVKDFTMREITNRSYVDQVLSDDALSLDSEFTVFLEVPFDIDQDGKEEMFYFISNAFPMESEPNIIFSIAFMVKNEKIYMIYHELNENRSLNGCKPFPTSFINVDQNRDYELIFSCGKYSMEDQIDMLVQWQQDGFKTLISNQ